MASSRAQFTSRFGFLMAATGSAVGLGNVWGFPTQAANNGGGAFVLAYLLLAFLLAYPALMAELLIGRYSKANIVSALGSLGERRRTQIIGRWVGYAGVLTASLILSFYSIVAGWMLSRCAQSAAQLTGLEKVAAWLNDGGVGASLLACLAFSLLTLRIVARGVTQGIERWSSRLMPTLTVILVLLIFYVLTLPGAYAGLRVYLLPDFSQLTQPSLLISAMGQAFFSLSLGVGTMLVYGSYLHADLSRRNNEDHLPRLGAFVALLDCGVAFVAGLLIIPAMYAAQEQGVAIFGPEGELLAGASIVLQVLPALFDAMGGLGLWISLAFFLLMTIAALTSSISMLEVPVSLVTENTRLPRAVSASLVALAIFAVSVLLIFNMDVLFEAVIAATTRYSQPLLGLALCLFAGWVLFRDQRLQQLRAQHSAMQGSLFWRWWPLYVRVICPLLIVAMLMQTLR